MASLLSRLCTRCTPTATTTASLSRTALPPPAASRRLFATTPTHAASPRPPRIAIIGSGPAGFYAAHRLISKVDDARVDMYEKLPVPFGLVRFGVAPDHPEVKNCEDKFTEVASSPRFTFIGNLSLGTHLPLATLRPHYDAILFAYGASHDRALGSATAGLPPHLIHSARSFVGWYNGLPEHRHLAIDLSQGEEALIIGNGNVALDVARVLLSDVDALRKTDIAEHALEELARSRVRRVRLVARRGLMQAAFTIKEARELLHLPGVAFDPIPAALFPVAEEVAKLPRAQKRLLDLLSKGSPTPQSPGRKSWSLDFLLSPVQFIPNPSGTALRGAWFGQMQLDPSDPHSKTARVSPVSSPSDRPADVREWNRYHPLSLPPSPANANTELEMSGPLSWVDGQDSVSRAPTWGRLKYLPADFAFSSVGYKACALSGAQEELGIPFDEERGVIPNDGYGRVVRLAGETTADTAEQDKTRRAHGGVVGGMYCAGWIKTGPRGVIATTMADAFGTADVIAADLLGKGGEMRESTSLGWEGVKEEAERRGLRTTSWEDWERINEVELLRGKEKGKIREKIVDVEEMLRLL